MQEKEKYFMFKKFSIQKKVRVSFAIIIIAFIGTSILSFWNFTRLIQLNADDKNSYTIISKLNEVGQLRRNIQTSLESLTSVDEASTKLQSIKKTYEQNITVLKSMTAGDSKQQAYLKTIEETQDTTIQEYETKLTSLKSSGSNDISNKLRNMFGPPGNTAQNANNTGAGSNNTGSANSSNTSNTSTNSSGKGMEQVDNIVSQAQTVEEKKLTQRESQTNQIRYITIASLGGSTVVSIFLILFVMLIIDRTVVRSIKKTSLMLRDIAEGDGDLTKRLEVKSHDEIGELSESFNNFIDKISVLIGEVITSAEILSKFTGDALSSIEESNAGMAEMAQTIEKVSESIQTSASASEQASASIQEVAGKASTIQEEAQNADERSSKVLSAASEGENQIKDAVSAIGSVKSNSAEVLSVINDLKKASDEIGQIVSMMTGITEQTSLLALNASIEAARAGEAGKGFAVVAEEVKKLAEESKGSAEDITKIVTGIQAKIKETESSITEEQNFIDISVDKVSVTAQGFSNILKYIHGVSGKISTMTAASVQQNDITSQMAKTIDLLSQGLQDNSAASQEISASVENQVNTFKEIQINMEDMRNIADSLKQQTEKFKL